MTAIGDSQAPDRSTLSIRDYNFNEGYKATIMFNLTSYGSSTEGYTSSGGFIPTPGGYHYTGGQEIGSITSIWELRMVRKYKVLTLTRVGRASRALSLNLMNRVKTSALYDQSGVMIKHCRPPGIVSCIID